MMSASKKTPPGSLISSPAESSPAFPELDVQEIKKKMRLKEEAAHRGKDLLPRTNAAGFDDIEQQIIAFTHDEVKEATEKVYYQLESFQHRMQNMRSVGHVAKMEQIALAAEGMFSVKGLGRRAELFVTREGVVNIKTSFENFKKQYGLKGDATYPENRFLHISVVFLLVVLETFFNGRFLARGDEGGLLGGVTFAFGFSAINAVLGFLLGYYTLRLSLHPNKAIKIPCIIFSMLIQCCMLGINLLLSWLRTTIAALGSGVVLTEAMKQIEWHDLFLSLTNPESLLLFGAGIICCIIITIDFWMMDDPFPGFGRISREYKQKIETYADMQSAILGELEEMQARNHRALDEVLDQAGAIFTESETVADLQNRWRRLYSAHLDHLEDVGKQLIGYYRTANMEARKTDPPPAHFQQSWTLKRPPLPEPTEQFLTAQKNIQAGTRDVQAAHMSCVKRISEAYLRALHEYQTIEQL
jgi:hypothetical protein